MGLCERTRPLTATTFKRGAPTGDQARVGQYSTGLGVTSHAGDSHQVDGMNKNDLLIFDFNNEVTLTSVTFSYVDNNDDFWFLLLDSEGNTVDIDAKIDIPGTGSSTYIFSSIWTGDSFGIGAKGKYDNFKVTALSVTPMSVVPLPPAIALFAGGLGVMGVFGWARKRMKRG